MTTDPPDFALTCALLFNIRTGDQIFGVDIPAVDAWIASAKLPSTTIETLAHTRARAVWAFENDRMADVERAVLEWHKDVRALRTAPWVRLGKKFTTGRKPGRLGPVAKRIKAHLLKNPKATPLEVWQALAAAPPKGHEFRNSPDFGRYVEVGAKTVMEFPRFRNLVALHRPKQ